MKGQLDGLIDKATFGRFDKEVIQKLRAKRLKGAISATPANKKSDEEPDDTEMLEQLMREQADDSGTENTEGKKKERAK